MDYSHIKLTTYKANENLKELVKHLNSLGFDTVKIRTTYSYYSPNSIEYLTFIKRYGWVVSERTWDNSLEGFNEIYIFTKIK